MRELSIYSGQQQIASVTYESGLIRFEYTPEYLQAAHAQPVSLLLPLKAECVEPTRPGNFIANHGDPDLAHSIQAVHTQIAEIVRKQIDRLVY